MNHTAFKKKVNVGLIVLLAPAIIVVVLIIGYPLVRALGLSLYRYKLTDLLNSGFIGLNNYKDIIFNDPAFNAAFVNTIIWVGVTVVCQVLCSLVLANVLNKPFWGRGVIRSIVLIPWATPCVLIALMWSWMFNGNYGVINEILKDFNVISQNVAWLAMSETSLGSQILVMVWQGIPFFTIMLLAAMQLIPSELYESADVDGAGPVRKYFSITLPGISATLVSTVMIRLIWVFNNVDIVYIMTGGGPGYSSLTLSVYTFIEAQKSLNFGYASALAIIGAIFMAIVMLVYMRMARSRGGIVDR